jgi:alpha,alpha-trehalase
MMLYSPLYEAVQSSGIFSDSKFFPDCVAKTDPDAISLAYEKAKNEPGFDLRAFVARHFEFPETPETGYQSDRKPIREHLNALWDTLLRQPAPEGQVSRSSLLPLPHPYVVPGGRFREVYYWDSYFTMLGLQVSGRADVIENMLDNFAYLITTCGHVPNGNRSYYLSRSQPPFFALMVQLLANMKGEGVLLRYRRVLEKEYDFWMDGEKTLAPGGAWRRLVCLPDGQLLNRYWDDDPRPRPEAYAEDRHTAKLADRPEADTYRHIRAAAESGWDFSSRWLENADQLHSIRTCDLIPVDLNCLLYFLEKTLVRCYRLLPDHTPVEVFKDRARKRKAALLHYCWDESSHFFFDYDTVAQKPTAHRTLAAVFPLFFQIADARQAAAVAASIEAEFLQAGGLSTTLLRSGQQWDAPNGWAPLQWAAYQGLMQYGYHGLAEKIRQRWMAICEKTYTETGKMMEKYNVEEPDAPGGGGEYPNQDGFGWTNGVYLKMSAEN